jgi:hypothetical protein
MPGSSTAFLSSCIYCVILITVMVLGPYREQWCPVVNPASICYCKKQFSSPAATSSASPQSGSAGSGIGTFKHLPPSPTRGCHMQPSGLQLWNEDWGSGGVQAGDSRKRNRGTGLSLPMSIKGLHFFNFGYSPVYYCDLCRV